MIKERKNTDNKTELLAITLLVLLLSLTGTVLSFGYAYLNNVDLTNMSEIFNKGSKDHARRFFRTTAAIHQIFTFMLPSFFFWWIIKRKEAGDYFNLNKIPLSKALIFSFLCIILSSPFVNLSAWLNQLLPLPAWATSLESDAAKMISTILSVDSPLEWILNLLVIAAIPAVGEELFFRGIVQTKLINYFKSPHLAIWLGAFFFSAFHFQFEGFFPRIVLGAVLGYLYYWSNNLWIPIILHFFNNAIPVSAPYLAFSEQIPDVSTGVTLTYSLVMAAIGATIFGYFLIKNRRFFFESDSFKTNEHTNV